MDPFRTCTTLQIMDQEAPDQEQETSSHSRETCCLHMRQCKVAAWASNHGTTVLVSEAALWRKRQHTPASSHPCFRMSQTRWKRALLASMYSSAACTRPWSCFSSVESRGMPHRASTGQNLHHHRCYALKQENNNTLVVFFSDDTPHGPQNTCTRKYEQRVLSVVCTPFISTVSHPQHA